MVNIFKWSTTAGNNSTADSGINWAEGQTAASVNNSARAMMARVAEFLDDLGGQNVSTGAANVYALTTTSAIAALENGLVLAFKPNFSNTAGATTLNLNGLGAKPLYVAGANPPANALQSGQIAIVVYDTLAPGGAWQILNPMYASWQPVDALLTAIAALTTAADRLIYATGVDTVALTTFTAYARTLLDDADAATARVTLGTVPWAGMAAGDVGSFALLAATAGGARSPGATASGANLKYGSNSNLGATSPSGTWQCHGETSANDERTVWMRTV
jgi:hypothetical protein